MNVEPDEQLKAIMVVQALHWMADEGITRREAAGRLRVDEARLVQWLHERAGGRPAERHDQDPKKGKGIFA